MSCGLKPNRPKSGWVIGFVTGLFGVAVQAMPSNEYSPL